MDEKQSRLESTGDNLAHHRLQTDTNTGAQKEMPAGERRNLAPEEVSKIIDRKIARSDEVPRDIDDVIALSSQFVTDMGVNPNADVDRRSKQVAQSVRLRQEISQLRQEIFFELRELKRRSERYVHVAESAGHWVIDAKVFVHKHPNLLWFLQRRV